MSATLTKEQKARARSFVAGLKKLKKALGLRNNTELAMYINQPTNTVKGWLNKSIPSGEKMLAVRSGLIEIVFEMSDEIEAIQEFTAQA